MRAIAPAMPVRGARFMALTLGLMSTLVVLALADPVRAAAAGGSDHRSSVAPEAFQRVAADSFSSQVLGENRVGITVTNYGFIGNNFNSRTPSFEYTLGHGFE